MNKKNLRRMASYIRTIPQEEFDMSVFQKEKENNGCKTVGCVVGHCINLDIKNVRENFLDGRGEVKWSRWIEYFTGIDLASPGFIEYLFGGWWQETDNTPAGAAARIEYVIKNGLPVTWKEEMQGKHPLSYKK